MFTVSPLDLYLYQDIDGFSCCPSIDIEVYDRKSKQ